MNEFTITITFADADMARVERFARHTGMTAEEFVSKLIGPDLLSKSIKNILDKLEVAEKQALADIAKRLVERS